MRQVQVGDIPVGAVDCCNCGKRSESMMYYQNNPDPFGYYGGLSDQLYQQYTALCHPECSAVVDLSHGWIYVCGPC